MAPLLSSSSISLWNKIDLAPRLKHPSQLASGVWWLPIGVSKDTLVEELEATKDLRRNARRVFGFRSQLLAGKLVEKSDCRHDWD